MLDRTLRQLRTKTRALRCWATGCNVQSDPLDRPAVREMVALSERLDRIVEAEYVRRNPFADTVTGRQADRQRWRTDAQ